MHLEKEVVLEHPLHRHHQQVPQGEPAVVCSLRTLLQGRESGGPVRGWQVCVLPEPRASISPGGIRRKSWGAGWLETQLEGRQTRPRVAPRTPPSRVRLRKERGTRLQGPHRGEQRGRVHTAPRWLLIISTPSVLPPDTQVGVQSRMGTQCWSSVQTWGTARAAVQFGGRVQFSIRTSAWHQGSSPSPLLFLPPQTSSGQVPGWAAAVSSAASSSAPSLPPRGPGKEGHSPRLAVAWPPPPASSARPLGLWLHGPGACWPTPPGYSSDRRRGTCRGHRRPGYGGWHRGQVDLGISPGAASPLPGWVMLSLSFPVCKMGVKTSLPHGIVH